uniref:PIN2/TERF1-interacting telomerase inhibitor 1 n=1 Tax=Doryrhamphus excisus TaxID=161450 RepID=UPI0025AE9BA7|nr:PIN2/TERF1-interacting telomerase inhibitor 1 [Doryrhamphus excisus]
MSMLAEPRRKQKWSVDPRNTAWSNDDSRFGQKMLERMGWSKGKGLGKGEQGEVDHIKVKIKNDCHGLGASASQEDNWIAHQDDFNDLLAQLNNCHGQSNSTETLPKEHKGFSLEEKSKTSKKRVHYMKFAKGKDLSSRSVTDLNCIFGKRAKSATNPEQGSNSRDSQSDDGEAPPCQPDSKTTTNTVTSTLSVKEYFAQRMTQLKMARNNQSNNPTCEDSSASNDKPKKKTKKKKSAEEMGANCNAPVAEDAGDEDQQPSNKKKKKRKNKELEDGALNGKASSAEEQDCEEEQEDERPPSRKKKHKKHKKEGVMLNGLDQNVENCEVVGVTQTKTKKHKKKKQDL